MKKLGQLAGVATLAAALSGEPVLAQDQNPNVLLASSGTSEQVTDCVGFVKEQRALAADTGISLSRTAQKSLLHECRNGELEARIAQQEQILLALDTAIRQINLRVDESARILDENGQVIAHIIAINGQWVIQRQLEADIEASQERQQQMLDEAERILNDLVG